MQAPARRRALSIFGTVLGLAMVALAVWIFDRTLARYEMAEVVRRLRDIPETRLALALGCTALSYFTQTLYDFLALASLGRGASLPRSVFAAFVANSLVNNMGFSLLTATSVRYRFYSAWGFSPLEIAQVVAMTKLSFFTGLLTLAGLAQVIAPVDLPGAVGELISPRLLGMVMLSLPVILLVWNGRSKSGYIHLGRFTLVRPGQRVLSLQIFVSALHLVFSGLALYFLLPAAALADAGLANPLAFLSVFMALKFVVLFFPIPGGLGVLEGTAVALLTPAMPDYPLLGGLLAYRIIYFLLPFALALFILIVYEVGFRSGLASGIASRKGGSGSLLRWAGARIRHPRRRGPNFDPPPT
jgi:uncharacterized membrane protein YbhN (UPF0104 family)